MEKRDGCCVIDEVRSHTQTHVHTHSACGRYLSLGFSDGGMDLVVTSQNDTNIRIAGLEDYNYIP